MRINPIGYNYANFNLKAQSRKYKVNEPLGIDTFSKSEQVSFKGLNDSDKKKVRAFSKELYRMLYIDKKFDFAGIQKIVRKFNKNLSVKPMDEAPSGYDYCSIYVHKSQFDYESFSVNCTDETLYLEEPKRDNRNDINELYVSAVHEYTHAIQANSKEMSCYDLTKAYLAKNRNSSDKDTVFQNAVVCDQVVHKIEDIVSMPIKMALNNPPVIVRIAMAAHSPKVGLEIANASCGISDYNKFVRDSVNSLFASVENSGLKPDRKYFLTSAAKHLECEAEAYNNEAFAYAKVLENREIGAQHSYLISVNSRAFLDASKVVAKMAREW